MGSLQMVLPFKLTATEALIAYRGLAFRAAILEGRAERRTVTARTAAGTGGVRAADTNINAHGMATVQPERRGHAGSHPGTPKKFAPSIRKRP
jgi:hypothetical protein